MESAYGESPDPVQLEDILGSVEELYRQEFDEEIDTERNPHEIESHEAVIYFDPGFDSQSAEHSFLEETMEELLETGTVTLLYRSNPVGSQAAGYEAWIKE